MGLFNKIKDILFVEEGEDLPVINSKEEVVEEKVIPSKPTISQIDTKEEISVPDVSKRVSPFVSFDEDEFERLNDKVMSRDKVSQPVKREAPTRELPKREASSYQGNYSRSSNYSSRYNEVEKSSPRKDINSYSKRVNDYSSFDKKKEEDKKPFKPSPVISPVYGVLNKNYKDEEIVERKDSSKKLRNADIIRETTLKKIEEAPVIIEEKTIVITNTDEKSVNDLMLDSFENTNTDIFDNIISDIDNTKEEEENLIEDFSNDVVLEHTSALEILDEIEKELDKQNEEKEEDNMDGDLFNLIDSMYDNERVEE